MKLSSPWNPNPLGLGFGDVDTSWCRGAKFSMLSIRQIGIKQRGIRLISLKPDFSKYKLKEQPPGFVVGTINEAYVPPPPNFYHGGHHWSYEKIVTGAIVPLTIAPFLGFVDPMIDYSFCVAVLSHCHMGLKSCIIDYIPKRVYGVWHTFASRLLLLGSTVSLYGIYLLETDHNGLFSLLSEFWSS